MSQNDKSDFEIHPVFGTLPLDQQVQSPIVKLMRVIAKVVDGPTSWFKGLFFLIFQVGLILTIIH